MRNVGDVSGISGLDAAARFCGISRDEAERAGAAELMELAERFTGLPRHDPLTMLVVVGGLGERVRNRRLDALERRMGELADAVRKTAESVELRESELFEHISREKEAWDREGMSAAVELLRGLARDAVPPAKKAGWKGLFFRG